MNYEKLFSPVTMRGVTFPNRIQRTSMVSGLATEEGWVTDDLKKRYQREAKGGAGSMVVEAAVIISSKSPYNLRISDDRFVPGLIEVVKGIREVNPEVKTGIQIMQHLKLSRTGWRQRAEDFKTEELPNIVNDHVAAAKRALSAGFDFIEIHMAHAYVLSSFLSRANKRTDGYGSTLENRLRLPIEVFQAVRQVVGDHYPLGVRITVRISISKETPWPKAPGSRGGLLNSGRIISASPQEVGSKMQRLPPKGVLPTPCPATAAIG